MNSKRRWLSRCSFGVMVVLILGMGSTAQGHAQTTPAPSQPQTLLEGGVGGGGISKDARRQKWQQLSPEQKQKLKERWEQWKNLDPGRKAEIKQRFRQYQQLSPELKEKVRRNWKKIKNLPPQRRREIVEKYQKWKQLPPDRKRRIREEFRRLKKLSPEQKQRLRERREKWQNLAPEQKQELREKFRQGVEDRRGGQSFKNPPIEARRPWAGDKPRPAAEPMYRKQRGR